MSTKCFVLICGLLISILTILPIHSESLRADQAFQLPVSHPLLTKMDAQLIEREARRIADQTLTPAAMERLSHELQADQNSSSSSEADDEKQLSKHDLKLGFARALINALSITASLTWLVENPVALPTALKVATAGALMSLGFQLTFKLYADWTDFKGWFKLDRPNRASLFEAIGKEFSLQLLYVAVIHYVSWYVGIEDTFWKVQPLITAGLSLAADGAWGLYIAKLTKETLKKFPQDKFSVEARRKVWMKGKFQYFLVSAIAASLVLLNLVDSSLVSWGGFGIMAYTGISRLLRVTDGLHQVQEELRVLRARLMSSCGKVVSLFHWRNIDRVLHGPRQISE